MRNTPKPKNVPLEQNPTNSFRPIPFHERILLCDTELIEKDKRRKQIEKSVQYTKMYLARYLAYAISDWDFDH